MGSQLCKVALNLARDTTRRRALGLVLGGVAVAVTAMLLPGDRVLSAEVGAPPREASATVNQKEPRARPTGPSALERRAWRKQQREQASQAKPEASAVRRSRPHADQQHPRFDANDPRFAQARGRVHTRPERTIQQRIPWLREVRVQRPNETRRP